MWRKGKSGSHKCIWFKNWKCLRLQHGSCCSHFPHYPSLGWVVNHNIYLDGNVMPFIFFFCYMCGSSFHGSAPIRHFFPSTDMTEIDLEKKNTNKQNNKQRSLHRVNSILWQAWCHNQQSSTFRSNKINRFLSSSVLLCFHCIRIGVQLIFWFRFDNFKTSFTHFFYQR